MISKELLSEVLGVGVRSFEVSPNKNTVYILEDKTSVSNGYFINIYELAHKCKEWAFSHHGYSINSGRCSRRWYCDAINSNTEINNGFYADTEQEAIFKACEWILNDRR